MEPNNDTINDLMSSGLAIISNSNTENNDNSKNNNNKEEFTNLNEIPEYMDISSICTVSSSSVNSDSFLFKNDKITRDNFPLPPSLFPVLSQDSYSWVINDFSKVCSQQERYTSPSFNVGGYVWYIQLQMKNNYYGVFLVSDEGNLKQAVCVDLLFKVCSLDGKHEIARTTSHRYPRSSFLSGGDDRLDWGFQNFIPIRALTENIDNGPLLQNNSLQINVFIRVVKDDPDFVRSAHMQLLNDSFKYGNSRQNTGFVGLHNQGATCYMNSILQSLFLTNAFRKATLQIPTEGAKPTDSIPLALQRIFYQLQFSDQPPNTNELTDSFGWDTYQAFTQHDVQEFLRALLDDLEGKMKKTLVEGAIEKLFVSKVCQIVQCLNVEFESVREDTLYDVQLPILGCKNLHESLDRFISPQFLEGSNKYNAEGFGLQESKMFSAFESLPPVLHLILMRYRYDVDLDETVKINDRYEFPEEIDMTPYIRDKSPQKDKDNFYVLHSVLVHSGDLHGGHYCAFIRDDLHNADEWYKFDDTKVTKVTSKEAIEENYGDDTILEAENENTNSGMGDSLEEQNIKTLRSVHSNGRKSRRYMKRITNAYMLVYIRKRDIDTIMSNVLIDDYNLTIPVRLQKELEEERLRMEYEKQERLNTLIKYVTYDDLKKHHSFDLVADSENGQGCSHYRYLKIRKNDSFVLDLKMAFSKEIGISDMEIWVCQTRKNRTRRPYISLSNDEDYLHKFLNEYAYFIVLPRMDPNGSLITVKTLFSKEELNFLTMKTVPPTTVIKDFIENLLGGELSDDLCAYEELSPRKLVPLDLSFTFENSKLSTGDIIVVSSINVNIQKYYEELYNTIYMTMIDVDAEDSSFLMDFNRESIVREMYEKVADRIDCPIENLRLIAAQPQDNQPCHRIKLDKDSMLKFFERNFSVYSIKVLYYSTKGNELDEKLSISIIYPNQEIQQIKYSLSEQSIVESIPEIRHVDPECSLILLLSNGHVKKTFPYNTHLTSLFKEYSLLTDENENNSQFYYLIIEKPTDEEKDALLLYTKKGIPGYLWLKEGELMSNVLKKIDGATTGFLYEGTNYSGPVDNATDVYELMTEGRGNNYQIDFIGTNSGIVNASHHSSSTIRFKKN